MVLSTGAKFVVARLKDIEIDDVENDDKGSETSTEPNQDEEDVLVEGADGDGIPLEDRAADRDQHGAGREEV